MRFNIQQILAGIYATLRDLPFTEKVKHLMPSAWTGRKVYTEHLIKTL